jgi:hypothetical protein
MIKIKEIWSFYLKFDMVNLDSKLYMCKVARQLKTKTFKFQCTMLIVQKTLNFFEKGENKINK